jgi:hypothetical protein
MEDAKQSVSRSTYDTDEVATASEPLFLLKGEYLNKAEAAAGLGVSPATLDRWNRIRIGPVRTKIGNQVYYRVAELKAWMIGPSRKPSRNAAHEIAPDRRYRRGLSPSWSFERLPWGNIAPLAVRGKP